MDKSAQRRCLVLCSLLFIGLSILSVRLVYLQVVDRARYAERAASSYKRTEVVQANRGVLLDRNEEIIAKTTISKSVVVDVRHLKDAQHVAKGVACSELREKPEWKAWTKKQRDRKIAARVRALLDKHKDDRTKIIDLHLDYLIGELARPLGMSEEALRKKIPMHRPGGEKVIYQDLPSELAVRLEGLVKDRRIKGVFFREEKRRWYLDPELAPHLIGYVNRAGKGMAGVEKSMNSWLEGKNGSKEEMRDIRGNVMPAHKGSFRPPNNGLNVQLTLDMSIQAICEEELERGMEEFQGQKGCVIVMDPHTGEILGMANRPHYNLNIRKNVAKHGYNFALQAVYEPGSTFKIIAASGALNEKLVGFETLIDCENGYYRPRGVKAVKDDYGKGVIPMWKIIQKSNNIGTYKMALKIGAEKFYEYARAFGFGQKSDVQLAGESAGRLENTGNPTDFSRASYGYGESVTPLQVANAYCVIANGGNLMQTRVVKSIDNAAGVVIEEFEPKVLGRAISEKTAATMRKALQTVTQKGGTATQAQVPGFTTGGKTGTARRFVPKKGYQNGHYVVSFAGMLPAEDPAFVCVVVIDDPLTTEVKRYGGTIAGPIWQRVSQRVAAHMKLMPTEQISQN